MSELRFAVRDAIARGVTLVLDQERFLNRVTTVIAESSGYPEVAAYLYDRPTEQFVLRGSTRTGSEGPRVRLQPPGLDFSTTAVVRSGAFFGDEADAENQSVIVIPLRHEQTLYGVIVILDIAAEYVSDNDLESLHVVGEEITPAISVAMRHQALASAVVLDVDTGAYTYDFFFARLEQETSRALRTSNVLTILFVETPAWELVERDAGYAVADSLLRSIATGITDVVRASDVVARRGRSGFAVLLPDSSVEGAKVIIKRIVELGGGADGELTSIGPLDEPLAFATGWASLPDDGQTAADLVLVADQRLQANIGSADREE